MRVISPVTVTPARLVSSSILDDDAPGYDPAKTYGQGERVMYNRHLWESNIANNQGNTPGAVVATPKWLDRGAINRWRMFDKLAGDEWILGTTSSAQGEIKLTLRMGEVTNGLALFGLKAARVRVVMRDPNPAEGKDGVVYDETYPLADFGVSNWWQWYFKPVSRKQTLVLADLPAYGTADLEITITNPGAEVQVGMVVLGTVTRIGTTVHGTSIGQKRYSTERVSAFGNTAITRRPSTRVVDYDVRIPKPKIDSVLRLLDRLSDSPAVFIGSLELESTITVGLFEAYSVPITNPTFGETRLKVRNMQ